MQDLQALLQIAQERHGHLCAGQVLGVRMALRGLNELGIDPERQPKRLIVFVEIDRCVSDAVATVTRCSVGKRTLKLADYGKVAATFVDSVTQRAVRVCALDSARQRVWAYAPASLDKAEAQVLAYQAMPDDEMLAVEPVEVHISQFDLPGPPLRRVACARCGEGINDGREVVQNGAVLCRACAGVPYYRLVAARP
jgi:formylmethanofuran dehydrogenase subunit E